MAESNQILQRTCLDHKNATLDQSNDIVNGLSLTLVCVGITLNTMAALVFQRKNLHNVVTTLYYRSIVWSDNVILLLVGITAIISILTGNAIMEPLKEPGWVVRLVRYAMSVALTYGQWSMVLLCVERTVGVYRPILSKTRWTKRNSWYGFIVLAVASLVGNIWLIFTPLSRNCLDSTTGWLSLQTISSYGYNPSLKANAAAVAFFSYYTLIPCLLTLSFNVMINWRLVRPPPAVQKISTKSAAFSSMARILLLLMLFTYICTSPLSIYDLYASFSPDIKNRQLIYDILIPLAYSVRCIKFLIFVSQCPRFRAEFLVFIGCRPPESLRRSSITNTLSSTKSSTKSSTTSSIRSSTRSTRSSNRSNRTSQLLDIKESTPIQIPEEQTFLNDNAMPE